MKRVSVALLIFLVAACSSGQTPQQTAFLHELADRPMFCKAGDDCDEKWGRAIRWVSDHSQTGLRTVEDNLIATNLYSSGGRDPLKVPEFTVVRYAAGKQRQRMEFSSFCEHGFECGNRALALKVDFVNFVMGPPPGVTVSADGKSFTKTIHVQDR